MDLIFKKMTNTEHRKRLYFRCSVLLHKDKEKTIILDQVLMSAHQITVLSAQLPVLLQ